MEICNKIIGTHDSMTYLKPNKWYVRLLHCFADCQDLPIEEQIKYVDCVDLRIYYNNGIWNFAHGLAEYEDKNIFEVLQTIKRVKPNCIIRLILEKVKNDKEKECRLFKQLCEYLQENYNHFIFAGGVYKKGWERIYEFPIKDNQFIQFVSSMQQDAKWYERFIPKAYAKRMNKINKNNIQKGINLFDFIEIDIIK